MNGPGLCVAILGPDGAGKSSLVDSLRATHRRPLTVFKVSAAVRSPASGPAAVRWLVRTADTVRVLIGLRIAVRRGRLVICDRHPIEDLTMAAEGRLVLGRGRRWLASFAPRPDLIVVLDAPPAVLHARRPEESLDQLARLRQLYLRLAREHAAQVVDATRPEPDVRDEVASSLRRLEDATPSPTAAA